MPRTILGKPVNEEKWEKAKEAAEKQGFAGNYGYIMQIYKQMAHLGKARVPLMLSVSVKSLVARGHTLLRRRTGKI